MTSEEIYAFSKTVPYSLNKCKLLHDYLAPANRTIEKMGDVANYAQSSGTSPFDVIYDLNLHKPC